jgi:hypothetical protein
MKKNEDQWSKEYKDFLDAKDVDVPAELSQKILVNIHARMNPSILKILVKLLAIHIPIGTLSLLICNQFGMSPFKTNFSLSEYFMNYGHSFCMFCCGVIFVSLSVLISGLLLNTDEVRALRKKSYLQSFLLGLISLMIFILLGAQVVMSIGLLWLLGGVIGGIMSSEIIFHSRLTFGRH